MNRIINTGSVLIKAGLAVLLVVQLLACGSEDPSASRIVVGPSKVLLIPNALQYQQGFVVQVTDTEGNPAPGTVVTIEMVPILYFKGAYVPTDTNADTIADAWSVNIAASCVAEDSNFNGRLDAGEDVNSNGTLEPTNPATLDQHPDEIPTFADGSDQIVTSASGFGFFSVTYPASQALWSRMRISATAKVSGSEEQEDYDFTLFVATEDISSYPDSPPGGTDSPYGTSASCLDSL